MKLRRSIEDLSQDKQIWEDNLKKGDRDFKLLGEFAIKAISSALLLNGGAAIAGLAFVGTLASLGRPIIQLKYPLLGFAVGAALAVFAAMAFYIAQVFCDQSRELYRNNLILSKWIIATDLDMIKYNEEVNPIYDSLNKEEQRVAKAFFAVLQKDLHDFREAIASSQKTWKQADIYGERSKYVATIILMTSVILFLFSVTLFGLLL